MSCIFYMYILFFFKRLILTVTSLTVHVNGRRTKATLLIGQDFQVLLFPRTQDHQVTTVHQEVRKLTYCVSRELKLFVSM